MKRGLQISNISGFSFFRFFMIIALIGIIIFVGFRLALFLNYFLGNDIIIRLSANQEDFKLQHGDERNVIFTARITTNPFCSAICNTAFYDVSKNIVLDQENFTLRNIIPLTREYTIHADEPGRGQVLYRYNLQCQGVQTFWCNTRDKPTNRKMLITAEYDLNESEEVLKNSSHKRILSMIEHFAETDRKLRAFKQAVALSNLSSIQQEFSNQIIAAQQNISLFFLNLNIVESTWNSQKYNELSIMLHDTEQHFSRFLDASTIIFNRLINLQKKEALSKEIFLYIEYDALCLITQRCISHNNISELAINNLTNARLSCKRLKELELIYQDIALENSNDFSVQNYTLDQAFLRNVSAMLHNIRQNIINSYIQEIPADSEKSDLLREILIQRPFAPTTAFPEYNMTPALIAELTKTRFEECNASSLPFTTLSEFYNKTLEMTNTSISTYRFDEPPMRCCFQGECKMCCTDKMCRENPESYPIIFLHGHDFSKDIPADYSLDKFNDFEELLEQEGYLSAGVVSLSTPIADLGILGLTDVSIMVQGSYYFDIFRYAENYQVLQAKSESIDTYALRLREIVDIVKHKTGRPRVILVAYSMGGLVARRYVQIFGNESVDKIITIATPHQGIEGTALRVCPLFGEDLECRDLDSSSLFMNRLNREKQNVPLYVIYGIGCSTDNQPSDGVVLENNARVEWAVSHYAINGSCSGVNVLHNDILNLKKYPEVYEVIKSHLSNSSATRKFK
jgi:pimeloyl-ACP methyl ester carboxylesterase